MRRFSNKANTRIIFRQGSANTEYLLHLYNLFKQFVKSPPVITTIVDKNTNKSRYNLSFSTLALPCFNDLYDLFYLEGPKRIPVNISEYITEVSLAYYRYARIMDDGGLTGYGFKLYTNAFRIEELSLLVDALNIKLGIVATINKTSKSDQYSLYISKAQYPLVIKLVAKYMHPSMLYKLNRI